MSARSRVRRWARAARGDDGSAMVLVMLAIMVVSAVSVLALGTIIAQVPATSFQRKNLATASAAEAGLDAGLAAIRNATSLQGTQTLGDRVLLPCWTSYVGTVGGQAGTTLTYKATIRYYSADPGNQSAAWRADAANVLSCGAYGPPVTPSYALIQSSGVGPALGGRAANVGNRSMETVYQFKLAGLNMAGGLLRAGGASLCYAAASAVPAPGSDVRWRVCAPGTPEQLWAYRPDYTIMLASSQVTSSSAGMCLSAAPASSTATPVSTSMQVCNGGDARQKWGIDDSSRIFGHLTGSVGDDWCLGPQPLATDQLLVAVKGHDNCTGTNPEAQLGPGAAGSVEDNISDKPLQWVNYKEFGRCLDITEWMADASQRESEILYPCKQDPMRDSGVAAAQTGWNQTFTWSASTKQFFTYVTGSGQPYNPANTKYCMKSPVSNGGYVIFEPSCSATPAFAWTVNRETSAANTRYTIVDGYGRCLGLGPPNPNVGYNLSSIVVQTCNGSTGQRWNSPPSLQDSPVKNTQEIKDH